MNRKSIFPEMNKILNKPDRRFDYITCSVCGYTRRWNEPRRDGDPMFYSELTGIICSDCKK